VPAFLLVLLLTLHYYAAMTRWSCLLILIIALCPSLSASDKPNQQDALNLLQQAVSKTNIFELPSFSMKAGVQIDVHGKLVDGTYQLLWNGPDQWREEIAVPGYSEVQIGGKGTIWAQRNIGFIPVAIFNLHQALGFGSSAGSPAAISLVQLDFRPEDTVRKMRQRKEHGEQLSCIEIEDGMKTKKEMCISTGTGTLVRGPSAHASHEDSDLQPVGEKIFPRVLSLSAGGKTLARVSISDLKAPVQFPPETFTPPAKASPRLGCMNPKPPRLTKTQAPHYPENVRARRIQGSTATDVIVGIDGVPKIQKSVESPNAELEASSLTAIEQWRYEPALCNDQPVAIETIFQVNYALTN
jgi:TonB family protein